MEKGLFHIDEPLIIYIFIVALPFSWASFAVGSIYRAVTLLLVTVFIVVSKLKIVIFKNNYRLFASWVLYLGYTILTTLWSVNKEAAITNCMGLILLSFIVVIFFSTTISKKDSYRIDYCWIITGKVCSILYLFGDRTSVGEYGSRTSMMIMGTATDPNEFASVFIVPLSLLVYEMFSAKKKMNRAILAIVMLVSVYSVLMSGSRGALISIIVTMLFAYCSNKKMNLKTIMYSALFVVIVIVVTMQFIIPLIPEDVLMRLSYKALIEDGGSGRSDLWIDAIHKIWNGSPIRMIFGYGQYGLTVGTIGATQTMHNQLLQQLSNYGIVGLVLYCVLILESFKAIRVRCPRYLGAFWGMMLMSLTITMSVAYKLLWILLLIPAVISSGDNSGETDYGQ